MIKLLTYLASLFTRLASNLEKRRVERLLGVVRNSGWSTLRNRTVKAHPFCDCCDTETELEVHHDKPVSRFPLLEMVESNLRVLCRRCHKLIGHCDSWFSYNPNVAEDVKAWNYKIKNRV